MKTKLFWIFFTQNWRYSVTYFWKGKLDYWKSEIGRRSRAYTERERL